MKAIIDEHPSLVPVGLGNNNSTYDVSLLASSANTLDFDFSDGLGLETEHIGDYKSKLTVLRRILYLDLAKGNPK
jgi:hypothetical protein